MLNFSRKRRSFQWCPDQSDRLNGAWDMHKNAQKVEQETQTKISCHYIWLLHGKNCPPRWRFLISFFNRKQAHYCIRRSITAAKRKEKEKKERRKKNSKNWKALRRRSLSRPKTMISKFDFCASRSQNVIKRYASGKKTKLSWCKCIFEHIKANLAQIQPKNHQNVQETPFLQNAPGVNGLRKNCTVLSQSESSNFFM